MFSPAISSVDTVANHNSPLQSTGSPAASASPTILQLNVASPHNFCQDSSAQQILISQANIPQYSIPQSQPQVVYSKSSNSSNSPFIQTSGAQQILPDNSHSNIQISQNASLSQQGAAQTRKQKASALKLPNSIKFTSHPIDSIHEDGTAIAPHASGGSEVDGGAVMTTGYSNHVEMKSYEPVHHGNPSMEKNEVERNEIFRANNATFESNTCSTPMTPVTPLMSIDEIKEKFAFDNTLAGECFPVTCRSANGMLYKAKLGSGKKGRCIKVGDEWYTPWEFESLGGRSGSKDWKRSIRYQSRPLNDLMMAGFINFHAPSCNCMICIDVSTPPVSGSPGINTESTVPIRYFTPYRRKPRTSSEMSGGNTNGGSAPKKVKALIPIAPAESANGHVMNSGSSNQNTMETAASPSGAYSNNSSNNSNPTNGGGSGGGNNQLCTSLIPALDLIATQLSQLGSQLEMIIDALRKGASSDNLPDNRSANQSQADPHNESTAHKNEKQCNNCARETTSMCSGCNKAYYCSDFCIQKDWCNHANFCDVQPIYASPSSPQKTQMLLAASNLGGTLNSKHNQNTAATPFYLAPASNQNRLQTGGSTTAGGQSQGLGSTHQGQNSTGSSISGTTAAPGSAVFQISPTTLQSLPQMQIQLPKQMNSIGYSQHSEGSSGQILVQTSNGTLVLPAGIFNNTAAGSSGTAQATAISIDPETLEALLASASSINQVNGSS